MRKLLKSFVASFYAGQGHGCSNKGNYEGALKYYQKSLDIYPENDTPMGRYCSMAHTLAKLGRYREARIYANKSFESNEKYIEHGGVFQEMKQRINEVFEYIDYMEQQTEDRSH